ncbi:LysR family transcriptional regulator [Tabrizicola soli]|uniref:LysR family transcriptional regulator n=1 Tax=Tabrizicola soli TaxID=2185115 RepID=A0ABV7DS15_9RHOB|nr:LysR family transcriptional regulator [Tabrizicola soli]
MRDIDLGWIRVFVEVGRRGSLSEAARALHLTQPAVSYQIKRAEQEFGTPLIRRLHRGVELTDNGEALFDILSGSVERIDKLASRIRARPGQNLLRLHTDYAFSGLWLIPRIHRFSQANPGIDIQVIASQHSDPGQLQPNDVAVFFGSHDRFGPDATLLMAERVVPVCAPALASDHPAGRPGSFRLIHLDSKDPSPWLDWRRYLAAIGQGDAPLKDSGNLRLNTYSLVIEAAMGGQGLALGWRGLIDGHLERGTLVPLGREVTLPGSGYFLVGNGDSGPATQRLKEWLLRETEGRD